MTATTILLLLVAAASTIAFLPPLENFSGPNLEFASAARRRRDVASGSKSGSGATSFAGSSSSSGSSSGPGYSTSISSRSGFPDSGQGLNSVNPGGFGYSGAGDFSYPNYANPYPGGAGYTPVDFHTLFMQYLDFMHKMAQQQAYAPNGNGHLRPGSSYISWAADGTSASPSIPTTSVAYWPYYLQSPNTPVSSAQYYTTMPVFTPTPKYLYNTDTYSNPQYSSTPYYSTPVSTAKYYNTPSSKRKYISTRSLKSKHVTSPSISTRQLFPASNTLSTSGQPAPRHYSRSTASISFNGGYYGPDQNNFDNSVAGGYGDGGAPGYSGISSRSGFTGADNFGVPQSGFYYPGPNGYAGSSSGDGQVSASASANLSPRGGFGSVSISPPPQGNPQLGTRMGSVPASGGDGSYSVFTSSSSGSSDVDGVKKSFKDATSVINDNGKVTTYHVSDP